MSDTEHRNMRNVNKCSDNMTKDDKNVDVNSSADAKVDDNTGQNDLCGSPEQGPLAEYTKYKEYKNTFNTFMQSFTSLKDIMVRKKKTYKELKDTEKKAKPYELIDCFFNEKLANINTEDLMTLYAELGNERLECEYELKKRCLKKRIRSAVAMEFRRSLKDMHALVQNKALLAFAVNYTDKEKYFLMIKYFVERKRMCEAENVVQMGIFVVEEMVRREVCMFYRVFENEYVELCRWADSYGKDADKGEETKSRYYEMGECTEKTGIQCAGNGTNSKIPEKTCVEQAAEQATKQSAEQATKQPAEQVVEQVTKQSAEQATKQVVEQAKKQTTKQSAVSGKQINFYGYDEAYIQSLVAHMMKNNSVRLLQAFIHTLTRNVLSEYKKDLLGMLEKMGSTIVNNKTIAGKCFVDGIEFCVCVVMWKCLEEYSTKIMEEQFEL